MANRDVFAENARNRYECSGETLELLTRLKDLEEKKSKLLDEMKMRLEELDALSRAQSRRRFPSPAKRVRRRFFRMARREGVPSLSVLAFEGRNRGSDESRVDFAPVDSGDDPGDCRGGSFYEKSPMVIGLIADEFNVRYLSDAFEIVLLNPDNYREALESRRVDFVLYMTSWRGAGHVGGVRIAEAAPFYGPAGRFLAKMVLEFARRCGIPTAFQSIEDPPSYKTFLDVARSADFIFTSCVEMVGRYKEDTGNDLVFVAKYGVNPVIHNPVGMFRHLRARAQGANVLFAGAWYDRFKGRCRDMRTIFDGVMAAPSAQLRIVDRNLFSSERGDGRVFPSKYSSCIRPPVEYGLLQSMHKQFDWTINVNSVVDSVTMCARRVYEVQALGCLVLSNASQAVEAGFPGVFQIRDSDEVGRVLAGYERRELMNMQIENVRMLYSGCTVYDRMNGMLATVGMRPPFRAKPVYVVHGSDSAALRRFLEGQSYPCQALQSVDNGTPCRIEEGYFILFEEIEGGGMEWLDDPHCVEDMVNAFKFADCDYVRYADEKEALDAYEYETFSGVRRPALYNAASVPVDDVVKGSLDGLRGFVIARERWGRAPSSDRKLLGVVIPVFGNEEFLWQRCLRSLLRSSAYSQIRAYLVDCRHASGRTCRIERIADAFGAASVTSFECAGVDAQRARAKGALLVEEPYVTFLDAEDEAANDGYARLLRQAGDCAQGVAAGVVKPPYASFARLRRRQVVRRAERRLGLRWCEDVRGTIYAADRFKDLAARCLDEGIDFDRELALAARLWLRRRAGAPVVYAGSKDVFDVRS